MISQMSKTTLWREEIIFVGLQNNIADGRNDFADQPNNITGGRNGFADQ